ncbi:hypothetical protein AB3S75_012690 [Citrus x aurantiifolia]
MERRRTNGEKTYQVRVSIPDGDAANSPQPLQNERNNDTSSYMSTIFGGQQCAFNFFFIFTPNTKYEYDNTIQLAIRSSTSR